jgi:hypothetical protein
LAGQCLLFVLKERHGAVLGYHSLVAIVRSDQLSRCHEGMARRGSDVAPRIVGTGWTLPS